MAGLLIAGAVVLAGGMSRRMGQPKVLLPWTGRRTILEQILDQLLLARVPNERMETNLHWPFERVAHRLSNADLVMVNLENPLTPNCVSTSKGTVFCGRMENAQALHAAGVDVVNIANNHIAIVQN